MIKKKINHIGIHLPSDFFHVFGEAISLQFVCDYTTSFTPLSLLLTFHIFLIVSHLVS